jgi:arabinan endo-1,5-alpha-L-arabinosidase
MNIALSGDLGTHDPAIIEAGGQYFLFQTGRGIPTKTSSDLKTWRAGPAVFSQNPAWIAQRVSGATDLWAPDISFYGGKYHLYYSASTFGSNKSCIGHATRTSLTEGAWADQGPVVCSNPNGANDDWNAIDPNLAVDDKGAAWLSFGSFWSGIQQIALDESGARKGDSRVGIATRMTNDRAIEAPYIVRRCGYYYLFASFDACCRGADSTYKIMVGRSTSVGGPYADREGTAMLRGGGTLVLQGDSRWKGPGHNAVIKFGSGWINVYHAYAATDGRSALRISELTWDADGWPKSAGP